MSASNARDSYHSIAPPIMPAGRAPLERSSSGSGSGCGLMALKRLCDSPGAKSHTLVLGYLLVVDLMRRLLLCRTEQAAEAAAAAAAGVSDPQSNGVQSAALVLSCYRSTRYYRA